MSRYIGNYVRVPSSEPTQASAPGIWSINEQLAYQRANVWPPARDPYYNQTVLHLSGDVAGTRETNPVTQPRTFLSDASTNNFVISPNGDVSARPFSPYLENYSGYAPGNCYVDIASNSGFNLSDNANFTIEFWINCPATSGALWVASGWQNTSNLSWSLSWRSNNAIEFYGRQSSGGAGTIYYVNNSGDNTVLPNTWTHYAVVRNSSTISVYVNGNLINTGTINGTPAPSTNCRFFGDSLNGSQLTGYISNFRFSRSAIYTQPFTPVTQPLTTTSQGASNVVFLGFNKNRFVDIANNLAFTFTSGNPAISANSPFVSLDTTSGSGYFDGSDYLSFTTSSNFALTGDFTIECWAYFTSSASLQPIIDQYTSAGFLLFVTPGSTINGNLYINSSAGVDGISSFTGTSCPINAWNFFRVIRSGSTVTVYCNGVSVGSRQRTGNVFVNSTALKIGNYSTSYFTGYLSDIRIVASALTGTEVPTAPLTPVSGTQLLTLQTRAPANNQGILDSSPNNFVVTRNGNVAQGSFSPFSVGGWSNFLDGSTAYFTAAANSAINDFGTGDFNIELWFYATSSNFATEPSLLSCAVAWATSVAYQFEIRTGGIVYFFAGDSVPIQINSGATTVAVNTWNHVAASRASGTTRLFVNGTQVSSTNTAATISKSSTAVTIGAFSNAAQKFTGYLSNVRIVKGQALYTGNFTPPTAALTTTSVGTSGANVATSVTGTVGLLTCQSNRFLDQTGKTITVTGSPTVQPFSPFAPTQAYVASQLGGSAYFDGSSDYLSFAVNQAPLALGNSDFTVEAWVYRLNTNTACILGGQSDLNTAAGSAYVFYVSSSAGSDLYSGSSGYGVTSPNPGINQWAHVAWVRTGGIYSSYLNGVRVGNTTNLGTATVNTGATNYAPAVGGFTNNTSVLTGYISGLRLIKGSGGYNANDTNIVIPTAPPVATQNTSLLLNFTGAGIVDSTGKNVVETIGNSAVQTTQSKWSPGSMYFDGNGDYLQSSAALSELVFLHNGTSWTADGWFYTGSTSLQVILGTDAASANIGFDIRLNDTTARDIAVYILRGVSGSWAAAVSPTNSWNLNTWTHFAVTLDNSKNLTVYANGVQVATASGSSFAFSSANPSYPLVVGRFQAPTPGGYFNGYMSDLRITRGIVRYVTGTGANANQMVFNGTNTLALPTRSFPLA